MIGAVAFTSPYGCWPLFGEPGILTAPAQDLGSDVDLRGEVEDDRVRAADRHPVARPSAELEEPVLDANAVESIRKVADASALLKSVCRTQRSGFSPRTRHKSPSR